MDTRENYQKQIHANCSKPKENPRMCPKLLQPLPHSGVLLLSAISDTAQHNLRRQNGAVRETWERRDCVSTVSVFPLRPSDPLRGGGAGLGYGRLRTLKNHMQCPPTSLPATVSFASLTASLPLISNQGSQNPKYVITVERTGLGPIHNNKSKSEHLKGVLLPTKYALLQQPWAQGLLLKLSADKGEDS